jgi:NTP pyrophosphatase (non-canonical NTP hydrolase)
MLLTLVPMLVLPAAAEDAATAMTIEDYLEIASALTPKTDVQRAIRGEMLVEYTVYQADMVGMDEGMAAVLMEEVGELARVMARKYGDQSCKESDLNKSLEDEMADVLWVLVCLANQTGVNLTEAFENNIRKKTERDSERHINNIKLV